MAIDPVKKYEIVRKILQTWNQAAGDYRPGSDDASVARDIGVREIDVRTIRWETVGDDARERAGRLHAEKKSLNNIAGMNDKNEKLSQNLRLLIEYSDEQSESWSKISTASDDIRIALQKLTDGSADLIPREAISIEEDARHEFMSLLDAVDEIGDKEKAADLLREIGVDAEWLSLDES